VDEHLLPIDGRWLWSIVIAGVLLYLRIVVVGIVTALGRVETILVLWVDHY
jgi:hypothetical protein